MVVVRSSTQLAHSLERRQAKDAKPELDRAMSRRVAFSAKLDHLAALES